MSVIQNLRGQVNTVFEMVDGIKQVALSANDRSLCMCCNKRKDSTVNGVCLPCTINSKYRPH